MSRPSGSMLLVSMRGPARAGVRRWVSRGLRCRRGSECRDGGRGRVTGGLRHGAVIMRKAQASVGALAGCGRLVIVLFRRLVGLRHGYPHRFGRVTVRKARRAYLIWARLAYVSGCKVNAFLWGECLIVVKSWKFSVVSCKRATRVGGLTLSLPSSGAPS